MLKTYSLRTVFFYDETEENELTKEYFSNRENSVLKKEMYYNVYNALNKILSDQNLIHKFVKMDKIIEDSRQHKRQKEIC